MPRNPSELTEAIRSLLDETDGSITHAEARPLLAAMGIEIAADQPRMSSELSQVNEYEYDETECLAALRDGDEKSARAILAPVFESVGFDKEGQDSIVEEMTVRALFKAERNHFDVTKFNWTQDQKSAKPSASRKPASTKNRRAKEVTKKSDNPRPKHKRNKGVVASEPKRRGRPRKVAAVQPSSEELVALELIEKLGGVSEAETRINELRSEADNLENAIELLAQLSKRSEELQKRLASAA